MAKTIKYRMYIDEVGNPGLESYLDDPNHRYLSLTGVMLNLDYVGEFLCPQMEDLKRRYFGFYHDEPIILHRKDLINQSPPFHSLRNPEIRKRFDEELLNLLSGWEYTVCTVCLDKKRHKETYTTWRYEPYHYCLEILLERFVFFLRRNIVVGDIMAESRGGKEDHRLKNAFSRLWERGTDYVSHELLQGVLTSRELKIKPKISNIAGLQLADLIAYSSRAEILAENKIPEIHLRNFTRKIIEILQTKYDKDENRIYGKKFI